MNGGASRPIRRCAWHGFQHHAEVLAEPDRRPTIWRGRHGRGRKRSPRLRTRARRRRASRSRIVLNFMSLSAGSRLGHYEIVAAIGAGGMGEVYEARDTKLDREVAIKSGPVCRRVAACRSFTVRDSAKAHLTNLDSEPRTSVSGFAVADIFSSASLISAFVSILLVPASGSSFRNHTRRGC